MLTIEEAINAIKNNLPNRKEELRKVYGCNRFILSEDVYSEYSSPYFDNSAMDGYAINEEDTDQLLKNFNDKNEFEVIGTSQAGKPFNNNIPSGKCIQINTGAKVPQNSGAVIPNEDIEYLDESHNRIRIIRMNKKYQNIRKKGEEFKKNTLLFSKGTILNPRKIALLLQAGKSEVFVYKKPRILLLTTGDELIPYEDGITEEDILQGKILNTNAYLLTSILEEKGYEYKIISNIKDKENEIYDILKNHQDFDFIIITGGVSVGPYDFVKKDVEKAGFKPIFWKISQKPGKPMYFAKKENQVLFGLPGNPVSAFINFQHYVLPALIYFESKNWYYNIIKLNSSEEIYQERDRDTFFTIKILPNKTFKLEEQQGSHKISSIAYADGYIIIPKGTKIHKNELYDCYLWM